MPEIRSASVRSAGITGFSGCSVCKWLLLDAIHDLPYPQPASTSERAFCCPEITASKPKIGINHPDQCQIGKMMALRSHLRAYNDINITINHRLQKISLAFRLPIVSLERTANRAFGKRCSTSSASRSTPGPQARMLSLSPQAEHSFGGRISYPQ